MISPFVHTVAFESDRLCMWIMLLKRHAETVGILVLKCHTCHGSVGR